MEKKSEVSIVRENKRNKQRIVTIPKKIESIKARDMIEFSENENGETKIKKL